MEFRGSVSHKCEIPFKSVSLNANEELTTRGVTLIDSLLVNDADSDKYSIHLLLKNNKRQSINLRSKDAVAFLQVDREIDDVFAGLVGPACETEAYVNGVMCQALMDSGSQVTTISRSFYTQNFRDTPLQPLSKDGFNIEGAGGQNVPFDGFIKIKMRFPNNIVGFRNEVDTVALVCPDTVYSRRVPVIVGTNTFRTLGMVCKNVLGSTFTSTIPVRSEVAYAYHDSLIRSDGKVVTVKIISKDPIELKPGAIIELKGNCRDPVPITRDALLLQGVGALPRGLKIINGLIPTVGHLPNVKVLLHNTSKSVARVNPRDINVELHVIEHETSIDTAGKNINSFFQGVKQQPTQAHGSRSSVISDENNASEEIDFDFSDSPLDEESIARIKVKLRSFSDVFSKHEYDVGRTDAIEHEIKLLPGPVIRERPRPIPLRDFEDARRHIQSLLDANIIKPSNSPYASPVVLVRKKSGQKKLIISFWGPAALHFRVRHPKMQCGGVQVAVFIFINRVKQQCQHGMI